LAAGSSALSASAQALLTAAQAALYSSNTDSYEQQHVATVQAALQAYLGQATATDSTTLAQATTLAALLNTSLALQASTGQAAAGVQNLVKEGVAAALKQVRARCTADCAGAPAWPV
jgi:hypothetical protein